MAGICIDKLPHSCGSRAGLQVFEKEDGSYDGYCFSCKTYVPDPYKEKPDGYKPPEIPRKTPEEIQQELLDVQEYPILALPERKLEQYALEYFDVRIGVSEEDGITPRLHYYPYTKDGNIVGYKVRLIENKRLWSIGTLKKVDLFGWSQAINTGAKTLFITEGELDAVALFQILKESNANTQYASYNPAVVSIPHGSAAAGNDMAHLLSDVYRHFKEVVLVFDQDDAGKRAVEDVVKIMPAAKVADLPAKDVNAALLEGRKKAVFSSVMFKAAKPKNTRLVFGSSMREAARKEAEWGFSWPWRALNDATRGLRLGETIYIGAGVKMG